MAKRIGHHQYVIIENWQYDVAVRLVVVVRTTVVDPSVTSAVLRYRCLLLHGLTTSPKEVAWRRPLSSSDDGTPTLP